MRISRAFLFQLWLSLVLSTRHCICKTLTSEEDPEELYSRLSLDLAEEEDADSRMESLLGTMKEGLLRQLNLSDVPREHSKISPPQFMMELYNKYASNSLAAPQSDVIRSFTVQDILTVTDGTMSKHRLEFNISIPAHEKMTAAELQLLLRPDSRSKSTNFQASVRVYEVNDTGCTSPTQPLVGEEVAGSQSTWVTFDVTSAIKSRRGAASFDVTVDKKNCRSFETGSQGCLSLSLSVGDNTSAALIVFSDDLGSRRWESQKELKEMILHEEEAILHSGINGRGENQLPDDSAELQPARRRKRKAEREYCRRTSLKVSFKDIGWDSWIVAPPEYDAFECRGLCYHPLTDESTPSKHALIQTLMNIRDPRKANMACCVPIKLDPITVMYQENGRLTIRYLYEEMKVAECGCR
ncbi:unnamed protein product [Ophioblennius macclurei]